MPMPRCSGGTLVLALAITRPSKAMEPSSGASKPAISRNKVVLPQPEGPSRAVNEPGASVIET